jgi:hypothetical protein
VFFCGTGVTAGFNFSEADQVPTAQFNRMLWTGLMGSRPYPALRGQTAGTKEQDRHCSFFTSPPGFLLRAR